MNASDHNYSVTVKKANGYTHYNTVRLQISVGQPYHEGEKFTATMDWARKRFGKIIICINDTLQRHNYCFEKGLPDAQARTLTRMQGDAWIARSGAALKDMHNVKIHRWDEWLNHPDFASYHSLVERIHRDHPDVKQFVDQTIEETWERRTKNLQFVQDNQFKNFHRHSQAYLLEETAAMLVMLRQDDAADVYPGSIILPLNLVQKYSGGLFPESVGEKTFTRIDFRRKNTDIRVAS